MKTTTRKSLLIAATVSLATIAATAAEMQRIGHTTLLPRNTSPDDKGMYAAVIDPTNGFAYFMGNYLFKLDITGDLPVPVGPPIYVAQPIQGAIDPPAGYAYFPKSTVNRYSLGMGTNPVTTAGTLSLSTSGAISVVLDATDPNPSNHLAYVLCQISPNPAKVTKVALGTFTELTSCTLNSNETNFVFGTVSDQEHGYAYFVTAPSSSTSPKVVKVKMTPGTNPPVRIGAVDLGVVGEFIDGGCIDTVHGYAYYDTYNSDTNVPGKVYKVKLEAGDIPPTLVGSVNLHPGEGRLSAMVADPVNGFIYFANDNTYPGGVYRMNMNGTNLPVECTYLPFLGGTQTPPPNGITTNNTTTNIDGILPFGEVFFRSAVIDPVRGYAYFGQDSRPNQVVKVKLAQIDPIKLTGQIESNGSFQLSFTNITGATFSAFSTTNLTLPATNWTTLGAVTDSPPGQYKLVGSNNAAQSFYVIHSP